MDRTVHYWLVEKWWWDRGSFFWSCFWKCWEKTRYYFRLEYLTYCNQSESGSHPYLLMPLSGNAVKNGNNKSNVSSNKKSRLFFAVSPWITGEGGLGGGAPQWEKSQDLFFSCPSNARLCKHLCPIPANLHNTCKNLFLVYPILRNVRALLPNVLE